MTLDLLSKGGDPEPWRIYSMTCSDDDLRMYIGIYEDMKEYEICVILVAELEGRQ